MTQSNTQEVPDNASQEQQKLFNVEPTLDMIPPVMEIIGFKTEQVVQNIQSRWHKLREGTAHFFWQ